MGHRLREIREEKRLTQEELAERSNVSRATIVAIETGKEKDVLMGTLAKIAAALETTVDAIFFTNGA